MQTVERDFSDLLIKKVQARGREAGTRLGSHTGSGHRRSKAKKHKARNKHCSNEGLTEELRGSIGIYEEKLMRE